MSILNTKIDLQAYSDTSVTDYDPYEAEGSDFALIGFIGILAYFLASNSKSMQKPRNHWVWDFTFSRLL